MTSFVAPKPLGERWLERRPFRCDELAERLDWWRAREESFRRFAPFDLEERGPPIQREERGACEEWFPLGRIARHAHALLRAHFDLDALDPKWRCDLLARASSWLDARRALPSLPALPSAFLESLGDPDRAEAFVFEAHDPLTYGHALDRYPEVVEALGRPKRVWDAGCGTGETSFSLARVAGEVVGTTPSPWELLMAERRGRPHDRERTHRLRAATSFATNVRFEKGDLRKGTPKGLFDVVFVGGVLGGALRDEEDIAFALAWIREALAPGGRVFIVDRFRADVRERARFMIRMRAPVSGFRVVERGSWLELEQDPDTIFE
jgi:SAM-dependent methyltransferase